MKCTMKRNCSGGDEKGKLVNECEEEKRFQFIFTHSLFAKWGSNFSFLPNIVKAIMGTNETNIMTISRKGYEICSTSPHIHSSFFSVASPPLIHACCFNKICCEIRFCCVCLFVWREREREQKKNILYDDDDCMYPWEYEWLCCK